MISNIKSSLFIEFHLASDENSGKCLNNKSSLFLHTFLPFFFLAFVYLLKSNQVKVKVHG